MASILSKPKVPDTSKQQALLAEQEKRIVQQETESKRKAASSLQARRKRISTSLITGGETGVLRDTLG